tara:strand:- start:325 stop:1458 length:1134 start_codon:yes stop_codon:yes gene_type:complete
MISSFIKSEKAKLLKNLIRLYLSKLKSFIYLNKSNQTLIKYIVENKNWSIKWDGIYISSSINKVLNSKIISISNFPNISSKTNLVHFGSQYMWVDWHKLLPKGKKYIVTFYHGKPSDGQEVKKHIDNFIKTERSIFKVTTASSLVHQRLIEWGIPKSKIEIIPIGVDTKLFSLPSNQKKEKIRKKLGFKSNEIIIGSFQKDGHGWDEGNQPKLIKGPDLFVQTVEILSKDLPIKVLLTGPARGYVKKELTKRQIQFVHFHVNSYKEIANFYNALDLYIVSSREEGGPKAIVESMASGVPLVSTNVGMASDFIIDNKNGGLINSFNPEELAAKSLKILMSPYKEELINEAREDVLRADWKNVSNLYLEKIYKKSIMNN